MNQEPNSEAAETVQTTNVPAVDLPRLVSDSVWVTIRDSSGVDHGPMCVCWVTNWEKSSPVEKVLWVHRRCKKATGGNPFEFVRVEYGEDPPLPRSTRMLNAAWSKAMTRVHNSSANISLASTNEENPAE